MGNDEVPGVDGVEGSPEKASTDKGDGLIHAGMQAFGVVRELALLYYGKIL